MAQYGVTADGFVVKPFLDILTDKFQRARDMFGSDVDLRATSALRKILDIASAEDQELWKRMEQLYYANFISTASGGALDLLGDDIGVTRRFLPAGGQVKFTLAGQAPGRVYQLPIGTLVETDPPVQQFRTLAPASLSDQNKEAVIDVAAAAPGHFGNVAAGKIDKINAAYAQHYLNLGAATISVSNDAPTAGGDQQEADAAYRDRLLGAPRTLWTLQAVQYAVQNIDGVRDCRLFDPLGGVDVALSIFDLFVFSQRRFGSQRPLGTPYFFDILVAVYPGFLWESDGGAPGVKERIDDAIREVRPVSIFPNLRQADNVLVGIRAKVLIRAGHDANAVAASIKDKLENRVGGLGLGAGVLYAQVLADCMDVAGVVDIQDLHLRRCPPLFNAINFGGGQQFQGEVVEAAVGESLDLLPNEIAVFQVDSELIDITISDR